MIDRLERSTMPIVVRTSSVGIVVVVVASLALAGCGEGEITPIDGGSMHDARVSPDAIVIAPDASPDGGPIVEVDPCVSSPPSPTATITPDRGVWRDGFVLPGVESAHDLATGPDGALYVGGYFAHVSGLAANNVARLGPDGRWTALGEGLPSSVSAVAVSPAGTVYAATSPSVFSWSLMSPTERDGTTSRIHRFRDGVWELEGTIEGGAVFGLAADGEERIYAVGDFFAIDGVEAAHFAVRTATGWQEGRALASPATAVRADASGACFAGAIDAELTMVVACGVPGAFTELPLPATFAPRIIPAGYGLFRVAPPIVTLARDAGGALVIAGNFRFDGFAEGLGSLARWSGDEWEPLGGGVGHASDDRADWGVVARVALDADGALVVAGDYARAGDTASPDVHGLARWTGTAWEDIPSAMLTDAGIGDSVRAGIGRFDAVARSPLGMVIAGPFARIEGATSRRIAVWNGAAWEPVPSAEDAPMLGLDREVHAIAVRGTCGPYVAGAFVEDGTARALDHVARWTGTAWERVGDGAAEVRQMEIASDGTLWITGFDPAAGPFSGSAFGDTVMRLREGAFEQVGKAVGIPTDRTAGDGEVLGIAAGAGGVIYVVGSFATIDGVAARNVAMWDGAAWQPLGEGVDGWIEDVAVMPDGRPVVVGRIGSDVVGVGAHVMIFEDGAWRPLGDLSSLPLSGVAIWRDEVVVASHLDGRIAGGDMLVARFDGTAWHDLGTADFVTVSGGRTRVVASGETLMLVGQLPLFEDIWRSAKLAVWHEGHWVPFENSTADFGIAAAATTSGIWLGGRFSSIAGTPADQISFFELERPD
jgi:hypothetical protein